MQRIQRLDIGVDESLSARLELVVGHDELRCLRHCLSREVSADGIWIGVVFKNEGIRRNQVGLSCLA